MKENMFNYNSTQISFYNTTKLKIHSVFRPEVGFLSNFCQNIIKMVCFDDKVHFTDEKNIVIWIDLGCGTSVYQVTPTRTEHINQNPKNINNCVKKPRCNPNNDQHRCSNEEEHT